MSRAVITGVGVVSAFGVGREAFFDGLAEGRSAVGPIQALDVASFPVRVAGEVPVAPITAAWLADRLSPFECLPLLLEWERQGLLRDRKVAFALLAAAEALRQAGAGPRELEAWLILAVGLEAGFLDDLAALFRVDIGLDWAAEASAQLPRFRLRAPVDRPALCINEALGVKGPRVVEVSACAAGALSVSHAASLIERGVTSIALAGATDSMINPMAMGAFWRLGAPSPRAEPDACRPFDRRRDGLAIGEGAALFVLEDEARAKERGARVIARVLGYGSSQDAYRATAPRPDGSRAAIAIKKAIRRADIDPSAIDAINAHGTGTPLNDPAEVKAIRAALGPFAERVPVSSIKGAVGHLMAASGAIELAASLLPFERGLLPGTAHHKERDPECDITIIGERPLPVASAPRGRVDVVLSNSFGFGGQNAAVLLGRP